MAKQCCIVQNSWRYYCNFWSNGWILTWQGSFLGSFFRAVQWWRQDSGIQNRTANPESNDTVILNLRMCHFSWFIQIYRGFVLIIRQPLKTQKCPLQVEFYPSLVFKCHLKETKPYQTKPNQLQPYTNMPNVFLNPFTLEMWRIYTLIFGIFTLFVQDFRKKNLKSQFTEARGQKGGKSFFFLDS